MKQNYSFLDFPTEREALQALELNNQTINGINLKLNWASHSSEYSCFVGDLDHSIDDDKLQSLFSQFKSLKSAKVVLDHSGNSKNYGFVRFNDEEDQRKAIDEMNGMVIEGSSIKVSVATPKKKHGESPVGSFQNTTVFVGGLNESITEAELASHFIQFGMILHVKIPPGMGCGFVTYQFHQSAQVAIQLMSGYLINNNPIRTSWGNSPLIVAPPTYLYFDPYYAMYYHNQMPDNEFEAEVEEHPIDDERRSI